MEASTSRPARVHGRRQTIAALAEYTSRYLAQLRPWVCCLSGYKALGGCCSANAPGCFADHRSHQTREMQLLSLSNQH